MIVEVNEAGEVLIPAELVRAAPHTLIKADRDGEKVVLTPVPDRVARNYSIDTMPVIEGRFADPGMTFRREDMYADEDQ